MLEKGSFQPLKELEERIKAIPLPNQLPKGIDFSDIPAAALKSSTLESLITQNEDLMARLSVTLRKNNELEERFTAQARELQNLRGRFETLKDQYMVLQEKDRMSSARAGEIFEQNVAARVQVEKLERLYKDLFVQAQSFQRRLQHLERYRARVKRASTSVRERLAAGRTAQTRLDATLEQRDQLVASFEARLGAARDMVDELRDKAAERDRLYSENVALENNLVFERRQAESRSADVTARLDQFARENADLRGQLKEMLVSGEAKTQELEQLRAEVPAMREERARLGEQVESLQALWNHKQHEVENLGEKNKNLQKLNQNISLTLNQQRKEIHELKNELEKERHRADEKIKTLLKDIQMLRESKA